MTREISLTVNERPIALDYFVQGFVDHTVGGMLGALEGTGEIRNLELTVDGNQVTIDLNHAVIPTNPFVSTIIRNTVAGMMSSLEGVEAPIQRVRLRIAHS
jgi:hypothetical protein